MSASEEFDGPPQRPRGSSAAEAMLRRRFGGKLSGEGGQPAGPPPQRARREPPPHPFAPAQAQQAPRRAEPSPQAPSPQPQRGAAARPEASPAPRAAPPHPESDAYRAYEPEPTRPRPAAEAAPKPAPEAAPPAAEEPAARRPSARSRSLEEEFLAAFSEDPPEAAPGAGEDFLSEFAPEPEPEPAPRPQAASARGAARSAAPEPEFDEEEEPEEASAPQAASSLSSLRRSLNEPPPAPRPEEKRRGKSAEKPSASPKEGRKEGARGEGAMGLPSLALPGASTPALSAADLDGRKRSREFALNFERLRKFGFITPSARRSRLSEEIRLIKRRLIRRMTLEETGKRPPHVRSRVPRGRQHVILFTSAKPSEGKSFVAVNLALSIILDEGLNVLLVDADAARPSLSKILGLKPNLKGLTDLLEEARHGRSEVSGRMLRTPDYPLTFIPAGEAVASATDLYGGDAMRTLMADLADRYSDRIILIDGPPLLASTEPVELARHAGQVVMVVDAERTTRKAVEAALDLLGPDSNVNLVLNKATASGRLEQFGSYYEAYANDSAPRKP